MTDYGTLERLENGDGRLRFERHLAHDIEKVWAAITEPDQLRVWFPSTIDGDRAAGASLTFVFPPEGAPVMEGEMRVFDPPHVIELEWGGDVLRIELTPVTGGTVLTLTDTFDEYAKAARDAAGWHACIDRLQYEMNDEPWPYGDNGRWQEVTPYYLEAFPADATTAAVPDFVKLD